MSRKQNIVVIDTVFLFDTDGILKLVQFVFSSLAEPNAFIYNYCDGGGGVVVAVDDNLSSFVSIRLNKIKSVLNVFGLCLDLTYGNAYPTVWKSSWSFRSVSKSIVSA